MNLLTIRRGESTQSIDPLEIAAFVQAGWAACRAPMRILIYTETNRARFVAPESRADRERDWAPIWESSAVVALRCLLPHALERRRVTNDLDHELASQG